MFAVNPIACKHLVDEEEFKKCCNISILEKVTNLSSPVCNICKDCTENWICLTCGIISCSRHVNGHAGEHFDNTGHSISASFSDHSFWCYTCDTYVHDTCLKDILSVLSNAKFNDDQEEHEVSSTVVEQTIVTEEIQINVNNNNSHNHHHSGGKIISTTTTTTSSTVNNNNEEVNVKVVEEEEIYSDSESYTSSESEDVTPTFVQRMKELVFGPSKTTASNVTTTKATEQEHDYELKEPTIQEIVNYIKSGKSKNIIVMSGAGISVAAGIPDFRSPKTGLYDKLEKYNLPYGEAIFDIDYFKKNPKPFYVLSKELFPGTFEPTTVHHFIKLLSDKGLLLRNFTQNIDTLERIAGIPDSKLVEAHGSFATSHCISCKHLHSTEYVKEKIFQDQIPYCSQCTKGIVKPDIVFFGETLPTRFNDCARVDFPICDLLIVIGTSLKVHPFASLINFAKDVPRLLINYEEVGVNPYGGFKFNSPDNKLDVACIGDCQTKVLELIKLLGWENDLNNLTKQKTTQS